MQLRAIQTTIVHSQTLRGYFLDSEAFAVGRVDFHFVAYHWAAVEELWPLDTRRDAGGCWWGAHWLQQQLMSLKYRGHVLVARRTVVHNEIHGTYPKSMCQPVFAIINSWLDSLVAPALRQCLLPGSAVRGTAWGSAVRGPPLGSAGLYTPWHAAMLSAAECTLVDTGRLGLPEEAHTSPFRPSDMLRRAAYIFASPGEPACFHGGHVTWAGCCQPYWKLDSGSASVLFGYMGCWNENFGFQECCYKVMPPLLAHLGHAVLHRAAFSELHEAVAPRGRSRPSPLEFGPRLIEGVRGACRKEAVPGVSLGLEWYVCRGPGGVVSTDTTFETHYRNSNSRHSREGFWLGDDAKAGTWWDSSS
eukprot:gnl/TRDRNA2_/TRDRNA2_102097_c0_seq2.p1 gnl/TRDRNA2_/TRDRNA2_102097_c0~~gnl/TRDRNA2_/TRDRNA2_102097_c0_seq2.p1  ORF type:complete len:360 (+),score=18.81 gnl/TRDRNA2_/TRDRNA2_102097_c0_seq2:312-1391(+)